MAKSHDQRREVQTARFLRNLTADSVFVGIEGVGYPDSFYRVYVKPTPFSQRWWRFESSAYPSSRKTAAIEAEKGARPGTLGELARFKFIPERRALALLFERAKELAES